MEVADKWQREWAGTAEYGKVTEGGITRRVARAMEVIHASSPGTRVRVMRAAYHSSAGPGTPASSYMLHSSRRIISSGFNLDEPPLPMNRPLEISSVPLESSPDSHVETENYKVTEPDDIDISEPSKWKGSSSVNTIRMPSEESSSTDNASIIDLDSSRKLHRKYSYDSESSDMQLNKTNSSRLSHLLDSPVTLSTLKYKSLLNNSSEWNTRRKSYSFEDTSLDETLLNNDALAMESSTDSGICKSSEIMNDQVDDNIKYHEKREKNISLRNESFQDWLFKNRKNSFYQGTKFKSYRDDVLENTVESNISLQATGKVSITLPISVEKGYKGPQNKKIETSDEGNRKVKKVEFCKTELHFAAESGKVNIITTDEKPPPSNDFRKRRSVFVPIQNMTDKPITLFGDKTKDFPELNQSPEIYNNENGESDENTAATKSILKNKIPKPKPYLLGENMVFGLKDDLTINDHQNKEFSVATAVSLINKQFEIDKQQSDGKKSSFLKETYTRLADNHAYWTSYQGPSIKENIVTEKSETRGNEISDIHPIHFSKNNFQALPLPPVETKHKTRQLRDSDLTYFGVDNYQSVVTLDMPIENVSDITKERDASELNSVRLIQRISHSVCSSEPESEDAPEYQNFPIKNVFSPIPTPRKLKLEDQAKEIEEIKVLKPIITIGSNINSDGLKETSRRKKSKEHDKTNVNSRSRSEPRKSCNNSLSKTREQEIKSVRCSRHQKTENKGNNGKIELISNKLLLDDNVPLYANLNFDADNISEKMIKKNDIKKADVIIEKTLINFPDGTNKKQSERDFHTNNFIQRSHGKSPNRQKTRSNKSSPKSDTSLRKDSDIEKGEKRENNLTKSRTTDASLQRQNPCVKHVTAENDVEKNNKQEHCSRSAHRRKGLNETKQQNCFETLVDSKKSDKYHKRRKSTDKRDLTKDNIKIHDKNSDAESPERRFISMKSNSNEKNMPRKNSNTKDINHLTPKRSEYVINYDDKNGTISTVCKVKQGSHLYRRKQVILDKAKDNSKVKSIKTNDYLLQLDDHQEDLVNSYHADRKWKTKVHVKRSCQLL